MFLGQMRSIVGTLTTTTTRFGGPAVVYAS